MQREDKATLAGLQVMRAIAALMVAVHHAMEVSRISPASPATDGLTTAGAAGVDIFFVISGFIMMVVSFPRGGAPDDPWAFLRKRIARIYPFYWFCAAIVLVALPFGVFNTYASLNPSAEDITRSLLLLPAEPLILGVSWTLVHEMNFYLLFAIMLFARSPLASLMGVTGLLLLQMALASQLSDFSMRLFLTRPIVLEFCLGLALGYAYLNGLTPKRIHWAVTVGAFAILLAAPFFLAHESTGGLDSDDRVWAWGIPSVVVVAACITWTVGSGLWGRTWMLLGDASYAIYLLHPFVMMVYLKALGASDMLMNAQQIPLILAATIASAVVGAVAHIVVERPLSKAARQLLMPRKRAQRPAPAPAP